VAAAFLRPGQPEVIADRIEQRRTGIEPERMLLALDVQRERVRERGLCRAFGRFRALLRLQRKADGRAGGGVVRGHLIV